MASRLADPSLALPFTVFCAELCGDSSLPAFDQQVDGQLAGRFTVAAGAYAGILKVCSLDLLCARHEHHRISRHLLNTVCD